MNKNLENEIVEYFDNQEIPELKNKEKLLQAVKMNKERKIIVISKRLTTIACSICLLVLAILPIIALTYKEPPAEEPPIYYGVDEATRIDLTLEQTQTYINANYPQYNFIFDDYYCNEIIGYYEPNTENLLEVYILCNDKVLPFITLEINLIISNQFIFNEHDTYIDNAEIVETNNYTLYKILKSTKNSEFLTAYIQHTSHKLYLNFKVDDSGILNDDFLNNFI